MSVTTAATTHTRLDALLAKCIALAPRIAVFVVPGGVYYRAPIAKGGSSMAVVGGQDKNRSRVPLVFDCGVPTDECRGAMKTDHNGHSYKVHGDYESARKCAKRHAAKLTAEGGPIVLASKPQRIKIGKGRRLMRVPIRG